VHFCCYQRHSGDVSTWASEARHEPGSDWITRNYHYRHFICRLLRCDRTGRIKRHDDVDFSRDQFGRELWKLIKLLLCRSDIKGKVLAFYVPELTQFITQFCLKQHSVRIGVADDEYADQAYV